MASFAGVERQLREKGDTIYDDVSADAFLSTVRLERKVRSLFFTYILLNSTFNLINCVPTNGDSGTSPKPLLKQKSVAFFTWRERAKDR